MATLASWIAVGVAILGILCLLRPANLKTRRQDRKARPDGIQIVSNPRNAKFEIVAVHGLGAHAEHTWTRSVHTQEADTPPRKVHLLRDLLPKTFPEARILSFAYDSDWLTDAPIKTAQQIGEKLRNQLREHKADQEGPRLPICFIGHSFGGIIIKQALCPLENTDPIAEDTSGIIFLGTPHQGSSLSVIGSFAAALTSLLGSSTGLLLSLEQYSSQLRDLADRFADFCERCKDIKIRSFCETKPSYILGVSIGLIVNQDSARGPASRVTPVDTDHSGLNKCYGALDPLYKVIECSIVDMKCVSLLDQGDAWIRQSYSAEKLKIERLSGAKLPMTQCYINLALVHQHSRSEQSGKSVQPPAFHPSLLERFSIKEAAGDDAQFDLSTLFNPRRLHESGEPRSPKRVLIRGRPGVGKTTLCKKIVHDFHHLQQWNDRFRRLLWVPLRRLSQRQGHYTLKDLLRQEYFGQHTSPDLMLEEMYRQCNDSGDTETLFLLDGLDEIWHDRVQSYSHDFVEHLLNRPNVIITSRPSVQFFEGIDTFDIELETVGFYPTQVRQYVESMEPQNAGSILDFLDEKPLIAGIVRIPIQLDALCFAWKDKSAVQPTVSSHPETMTDLYQAIEKGIWKKDAVALEKIKQRQAPLWPELERFVEKEMILLENLAFTGMHNHLTIFDVKTITQLSGHMETPLLIDSTLRRLSLLRSSGISPIDESREYYFLHLTLQEYFAARYIKRQWMKGDKGKLQILDLRSGRLSALHPAAFLQRYKYDEHFDIVWRFLCGLLNSDTDGQVSLFKAIQSQPRDILGPAHQRLVMRCLFETRIGFPLRRRLEDQLSTWLDIEYRFLGQKHRSDSRHGSLAGEMEFPMDVIHRKISHNGNIRAYLLPLISQRRTIIGPIIDLAFKYLHNHSDGRTVLAALNFFKNLTNARSAEKSNLPEAVLQEVIKTLDHPIVAIQRISVQILQQQPILLPYMLEAVLQKYEDESVEVRVAAVEMFRDRQDVPETVFQAVAKRLDDGNRGVRRAAAEILQSYQSLSSETIRLIIGRIMNYDSMTQIDAVHILANQSSLPESIIDEIVNGDEAFRQSTLSIFNKSRCFPKEIFQAVIRNLENKNSCVRLAAVRALGRVSYLPSSAISTLCKMLEDQDSKIRSSVILILQMQRAQSETLFGAFLRGLEDEKSFIREHSIKGLKQYPNLPEAVLQAFAKMLKHDTSSVSAAASSALRKQSSLPEPVLESIMKILEDADEYSYIIEAAIEVFQGQQTLPETALRRIIQILEDTDEDHDIRKVALMVFQGHPTLPESALKAIVQILEDVDEDCNIREAAIEFFQDEATIPEAVLKAMIHIIKNGDENPNIRWVAIRAFEAQPSLPEAVLESVIRLTEDGYADSSETACHALSVFFKALRVLPDTPIPILHATVQMLRDPELCEIRDDAKDCLSSRKGLPKEILLELIEMLGDDMYDSREAAFEILKEQPAHSLSEQMLKSIASGLPDYYQDIDDVTDLLGNQPYLSLAVLEILAGFLERKDCHLRKSATDILGTQENLPEALRQKLLQMLDDPESDVSWAAAESLGNQRHLSEAMLEAVAEMLESQKESLHLSASNVFSRQLEILSRQSNLSEGILHVIARNLQRISSSDTGQDLLWMLRNNPQFGLVCQSTGSFDALFEYLLRQSFGVHFVWYHHDEKHCLIVDGTVAEHAGMISTWAIDEAQKACSAPVVAIDL